MTYEAILKDLKHKIYAPVYFLYGEESYYIDELSNYMEEHILDEMEREFNQTIVYGKDTELSVILSAAKRFPMMSNYQVVLVREAQDLKGLFPKRSSDDDEDESEPVDSNLSATKTKTKEKSKGNSDLDNLLTYMEKPQPSTILIFCVKHRKLTSANKILKTIEKLKLVSMESAKLRDDKVPGWIESYLSVKSGRIQARASMLLSEYLGNDLGKIANELDKLLLNIKKGEEISTQHIEHFIGISKDFNVFELQNALGRKNALQAYRIVQYFAANPKNNPAPLVMGSLYNFFSKVFAFQTLQDKSRGSVAVALKVNPYFITDYEQAAKNYPLAKMMYVLEVLHETDMKFKGVDNQSTGQGELLQEMVAKILLN